MYNNAHTNTSGIMKKIFNSMYFDQYNKSVNNMDTENYNLT